MQEREKAKEREARTRRKGEGEWLQLNRILMKVLRVQCVHIESERIGHLSTPPFEQIRSKLFQQ